MKLDVRRTRARALLSQRDLHIQELELLLLGQGLEVEAHVLFSAGHDETCADLVVDGILHAADFHRFQTMKYESKEERKKRASKILARYPYVEYS